MSGLTNSRRTAGSRGGRGVMAAALAGALALAGLAVAAPVAADEDPPSTVTVTKEIKWATGFDGTLPTCDKFAFKVTVDGTIGEAVPFAAGTEAGTCAASTPVNLVEGKSFSVTEVAPNIPGLKSTVTTSEGCAATSAEANNYGCTITNTFSKVPTVTVTKVLKRAVGFFGAFPACEKFSFRVTTQGSDGTPIKFEEGTTPGTCKVSAPQDLVKDKSFSVTELVPDIPGLKSTPEYSTKCTGKPTEYGQKLECTITNTINRNYTVTRLEGADRYETAVKVSKAEFPDGASTVYVAAGQAFPDALTGSAAAFHAEAPLLLVKKDSIPASVAAELVRLKPSRIVVQGGAAAVSDAVFSQLSGYASGGISRNNGTDRYDTAIRTAQAYTGVGGYVIIATGRDFPDALSAGSLFGSYAGPILLTVPGQGLSAAAKAELQRLAPARVFVLGGSKAVADQVATDAINLGYTVTRLAGSDRYATSVEIAKWVRDNGGFDSKQVITATGAKFPDGLTAGVLAGNRDAPLVLTNGTCWTENAARLFDTLVPTQLTIAGGTAAVAKPVESLTLCK